MAKKGNDIGDVFAEYATEKEVSEKDAPDAVKKYDTYGGEVKREQETVNIKCENCGLNLEFDPESGNMKCPACGSEVRINADKEYETNEFDPEMDVKFDWQNETRVFKCSNCGAETVFDKTEFATECAFCGSPNVAATNQIEGIRPDIVLPFKLTVEAAKEYYTKWIKKRFFAPNAFKRKIDVNQFKGVYSPCWLFDTDTASSYNGVAGQYYTVTVGSGENRRTEQRVRWYPVSGFTSGAYRNVLVEASPHMQQDDIEKLKPFPPEGFVSYDKRYLLGYTADHYENGLKEGWQTAKVIIDKDIDKTVNREILRTYDTVKYVNIATNYSEKQYKYALFPIYVSRVSFKQKIYNMFTNGVTGKSTGKYPKSIAKILAVVFGALLAVGGIITAVVLLL